MSDNLGKVLKALVIGDFLVKDPKTKLYRLPEANPPPPDRNGAHTHLLIPLRRICCERRLGMRNP